MSVKGSGKKAKYCSDKCRMKQNRYNAKSIKIHDIKYDVIYDWELIEDLSLRYTKDKDWIRRGVLACRNADVSPEYFINKYLECKDIPTNQRVNEEARKINYKR